MSKAQRVEPGPSASDRTTSSVFREILSRRIERISLVVIALIATAATFAETVVLFVITLGAVRLSDEEVRAVSLPFGAPLDELGNVLLLAVGAIALLFRLAALSLNAYISARMSESLIFRWRRRLFLAFQETQWRTQASQQDGAIQTVTQTHVARVGNMVRQLAAAVTAGISFLTFIVGALMINPLVALGLLAFGSALFAILRPFTGLVRSFATAERSASKEYARLLEEASAMSLEQKVFGTGQAVASKLETQLHLQAQAGVRLRTVAGATPQLYTAIGYGSILAGMAVASRFEIGEVAVLGALVLMMIRSIAYGQTFQATTQAVSAASPFATELLDIVGLLEVDVAPDGQISEALVKTIELHSATIGYPLHTVSEGIDLTVNAGQSIGVVGPSGVGKSTLALTILGLIPPLRGEFMINGTPASDLSRQWWHANFSFVPQQPVLFDGTVAENIALHRTEVTRSDIDRAARLAHLSSAIESWPEGLDHPVGPRGGRLSGGQRQRVCIARALASQPQVLILDEPTSALDTTAEESITEVLDDLRASCTLIIIAHRLSTLSFCDQVLMVDSQGIRAIGTGLEVLRDPKLAATLNTVIERKP